ncbi:hypothetical protein KP509_09G068100 [Ceratopteris richardii]|uniref:Uncharacterized protein n=2 Tax=Ceratopteris richardii TaxID=49495 RepID=A0A8T2U8Z8_CERRI|nr:hypothetical protein KP509_09G068100 [Ceratopteris richardii]KAH7429835.1 hypothetical protein KP509_09G068100 [Ceratopteris richardii]KAH7429836.1 hypothetical protein KP509_09G068100 [Ceratopteris richardii]
MESGSEVLAARPPPPAFMPSHEQFRPELLDGVQRDSHAPSQLNTIDDKASKEFPKETGGHAKPSCENSTIDKSNNMETELLIAQEKIKKLLHDLTIYEKKLSDKQREHTEELSALKHESQISNSVFEDKIKLLQTENAHLRKELHGSGSEVSDLKQQLEASKLVQQELQSQVDRHCETIQSLEKQLNELDEQAKGTKKNLLLQIEASQAELNKQTKALEHTNKMYNDVERELQRAKGIGQESEQAMKLQVSTLEGSLKNAENEVKAKNAVVLSLQGELATLNSKLLELTKSSEERLRLHELQHQEKSKAYGETCNALQKSILALEKRTLELQSSLDAAKSDAEQAKCRIAELDKQLEALQKMKKELEERSSNLQSQLKNMEESSSKQVDGLKAADQKIAVLKQELESLLQIKKKFEEENAELQSQLKTLEATSSSHVSNLKAAEEKADAANRQVVSLQTVLKTTEEMLQTSEEASGKLKQEITELKSREALSKQHLDQIEKESQKVQLELQSKLKASTATSSQLQEEVAQLQKSLSMAIGDVESEKLRASQSESMIASLKCTQHELEEKIKSFEEKSSQYETAAQTSRTRALQLEGLITEHKKKTDDLNGKVATLEVALLDSQNSVTDLKNQLKVAIDNNVLSNTRINELENICKDYKMNEESLLQVQKKLKQETTELQLQVKNLDSVLRSQENNLKVAEEKTNATNQQVVHLQNLLAKTEDMVRTSEEVNAKLKQEVTKLESREASSAEYINQVQKDSQKLQLELQSKLETSVAASLQLEGKVAQLENLLSTAIGNMDSEKLKVSQSEATIASLQSIQHELEEKINSLKEKCSQHETAAQTSRTRAVELEGLIVEHKSKTDDFNGKVATLELALRDSQNLVANLKQQLEVAISNNKLSESESSARITELENICKDYKVKTEELQNVVTENHIKNKKLTDSFNEIKLMNTSLEEKIARMAAEKSGLGSSLEEYKSLFEKKVLDLNEASALEKKLRDEASTIQAAMSQLQNSIIQSEKEKQALITDLNAAKESFICVNAQLEQERQNSQLQMATIMQENSDLGGKLSNSQEKLQAALAAAESSAKQAHESSLRESSLQNQIEELNLHLKNALDHQQEKESLAKELTSTQSKLQATLEAAELSSKQLGAASIKESELNAEIVALRADLKKAADAKNQVEKLELTLKNTGKEHQTHVDQLIAASREAESKLAVVEEQLINAKLEIKQAQKVFTVQDTHVENLVAKTVSSDEIVDQKHLVSKNRDMDLDFLISEKKKKSKIEGANRSTDAVSVPRVVQKPQQSSPQSWNQYLAHFLIALVSLIIGFWFARKVHP